MINKFVLGGNTAGGTGGKWQHKLEQDEIPYHRHSIDEGAHGHNHTKGNHKHNDL